MQMRWRGKCVLNNAVMSNYQCEMKNSLIWHGQLKQDVPEDNGYVHRYP